MKTPSSLALILLCAALPAAAEPKPGQRCDTDWLEKTQALMSQSGRTVSDERVEIVGDFVKLKFGHAKTCDAATWRQLATVEPVGEPVMDPKTHQPVGGTALRWRNKAAGDFWKDTAVAQHIGLVLVVNDFFGAVDAKAAAVVAAGDEVLDAAKALGFADFTASEKSLAELQKNTSGGPIGAIKPRMVTIQAEGKKAPATVAPEQLLPTMRKLVNDGPTLGDSVIKFRVAVLALEAELARLGKSDDFLKKRVAGATPGLNDFTSGLPKEFVLVEAERANALKNEKYGAALTALVGPGTVPELADQGLRGAALLDPIDLGLRNLVAVRSAQVDKIFEAAKKHLAGRTLAQYGVSARTSVEAAKQPANSLSADVVKRLEESSDYAALDNLYAGNIARHGADWAKTPDGMAMAQAREDMLKAARSATVETQPDGSKVVVFTQNGKKVSLTSVVPSAVENNASVRNDVAGMISRFIVAGAKEDARKKGVWAAIGGAGQPGQTMDTGLGVSESELARSLPPAPKSIKEGAAGCDNPKDLIRNDYETYAARKRAAAAAAATNTGTTRADVERQKVEKLATAELVCKQELEKAAATPKDFFDSPAIAKAKREEAEAKAKSDCAASKQVIEQAATDAIAKITKEDAERDARSKELRKESDGELTKAFGDSILRSVETLRKDYTTKGSPRLKKLAELTGNSSKLTVFTRFWFDKEWPVDAARQADLKAATDACAKALGLGDASDSPSYRNPEKPDAVDKHCKINEKLTAYIKSVADTNQQVP
ncbi:MAG: hypothetical protein HYX59_08615 [Elusimicrobia bacterium]|nr:hypothetical protein [Elusimicrobiota bacterium]